LNLVSGIPHFLWHTRTAGTLIAVLVC
jgi:hypothetical protein